MMKPVLMSLRILFALVPTFVIGFITWILFSKSTIPPWGGPIWFIIIPSSIVFTLFFVGLRGLVTGLGPKPETGKPFAFPKGKNVKVFGVSSFAEASKTNHDGIPVGGVVLQDASLIATPAELAASKHRRYVVFEDVTLGESAENRYWQQKSEKRPGSGLPAMARRSSNVIFVEVGSNGTIASWKSVRAAQVTLSVDTNDFSTALHVSLMSTPKVT